MLGDPLPEMPPMPVLDAIEDDAAEKDAVETAPATLAVPVGQGNWVVQPGEGLARIAAAAGHSRHVLWALPENAALAAARGDPEVLLPGDRLTVPPIVSKQLPAQTDSVARFRRKGIPVRLTHVLQDEDGKPLAGKRYRFVVGAARFEGTTAADGKIAHWVPVDAREAELEVWPDMENLPESVKWPISIGHLDPLGSVRGVIARLNNLGYAAGPPDDVLGDVARMALERFQSEAELPSSGEIDEATLAAMGARYGI